MSRHELRSPLARLQLALSLARRDEAATRAAPRARRLRGRPARAADRPHAASSCAWSDPLQPARARERRRRGELLRTIAAEVAIEADAQGCLVRV